MVYNICMKPCSECKKKNKANRNMRQTGTPKLLHVSTLKFGVKAQEFDKSGSFSFSSFGSLHPYISEKFVLFRRQSHNLDHVEFIYLVLVQGIRMRVALHNTKTYLMHFIRYRNLLVIGWYFFPQNGSTRLIICKDLFVVFFMGKEGDGLFYF